MNPTAWTGFFKNRVLWKGVGLGVALCVTLLAVLIVSAAMSDRMAFAPAHRSMAYLKSAGNPGEGAGAPEDTVQADAPKVIYKAQLDLQVGNCSETVKKVQSLVASEAGFVESSTLEENSARITLRVPSAHFDAMREKLRGLAVRVKQDNVSAADVSKQYVDREARLRNLRAEELQFLEVMKKAHSVPDVLAVTKELSQVRGEIERADAEFRHLKDQIDMAQIDVNLASEVVSGVRWAAGSSAKSALHDLLQGLANFADFLIWLVVNVPLLLLWVVMIFMLVAACWYVLKKAARIMRAIFPKKAPTTAPTP